MNKNMAGNLIQTDKAKIIADYLYGVKVYHIAEHYEVVTSTMVRHLRNWGMVIKKGDYEERPVVRKHWKRKKSPELVAQQKINSRVNDEHIIYCKFEHSTEDQWLVSNIINRPIIG